MLDEVTLCQCSSSEVKQFIFKNGENDNHFDLTKSIYPLQEGMKFKEKQSMNEPSMLTILFYNILKLVPLCFVATNDTLKNIGREYGRALSQGNARAAQILKVMISTNLAQRSNNESLTSINVLMETLNQLVLTYLPKNTSTQTYQVKITPLPLALLPEYIIDAFVVFLASYMDFKKVYNKVQIVFPQNIDLVICSYIQSPYLCVNPYKRAQLGEELGRAIFEEEMKFKRAFELLTHEYCKHHLVFSLLCFYVDCEKTGSHSQYFDKLNFRQIIQECLLILWKYQVYQDDIIRVFNENSSRIFPSFVQFIISDTTMLLENAFINLSEIKRTEDEMKDPQIWNKYDQKTRDEKVSILNDHQGRVKTYFRFTTTTFKLLRTIVAQCKKPFLDSIVIRDVAGLLNYFFSCLLGDKSKSYNVSDFDKYNFHPRNIVTSLFRISLVLCQHDDFIKEICEDKRSFQIIIYESVLQNMQYIKSAKDQEIRAFEMIVEKLKNYTSKDIWSEVERLVDLDIPDEYMCSIMSTLMKDPVELPNSGQIVDRVNIEKLLMNAKEDPFDRTPLTLNMIKERPDLKEEIEKYVMEKAKELNLI